MPQLNCPSCGASVNFRSKASVFAVCSFCKSTLVRHDMNLSLRGKMADLQDDMTPLQIGSSGIHNGKAFEVIGRLHVSYEDGVWNEWYAMFSGDKIGWLAEAQGFWAMCFPVSTPGVPTPQQLSPGMRLTLGQHGEFMVEDIRDVVCRYSEGELPMDAAQGRKSRSVDLAGANDKMATIEYADDGVRVFVGAYQEFDSFKFKNLREIDGW
jgi:hypothetical protein